MTARAAFAAGLALGCTIGLSTVSVALGYRFWCQVTGR